MSTSRGKMVQDDRKAWNPYLAGALAGLLMIGSTWLTGKYIGASTTFVRSAGFIEKMFGPETVSRMAYYLKEKPMLDWQWMFVLGIFGGSLLSSLLSGTFRWQAIPDRWQRRFGPGRGRRALTAFAGGAIAMYGARLADG